MRLRLRGKLVSAAIYPALLVGVGTLAAFAGAWAATRHLEKLTITAIRSVVAVLMCLIGLALCAGVLG